MLSKRSSKLKHDKQKSACYQALYKFWFSKFIPVTQKNKRIFLHKSKKNVVTNYNSFGVRKTERIKTKGDDWVFRSYHFFYKNKLCQYQCKLLMVEKKVHKVQFLFLSHRQISKHLPLTQFCTSRGNEKLHSNACKFQKYFCAL